MTTSPSALTFGASSPFYTTVIAYKAAVAGLLIYTPHITVPASIEPIAFDSVLGPARYGPAEMVALLHGRTDVVKVLARQLTLLMLNLSHALLKERCDEKEWKELAKTPECQFFRHVRNAASHGGVWFFRNHEPSRPAIWRGKSASRSLQGHEIFDPRDSIFKPGDALILLWDIEQIAKKTVPRLYGGTR